MSGVRISHVDFTLPADTLFAADAHVDEELLHPLAGVTRQLDEVALLFGVGNGLCVLLLLDGATAFELLTHIRVTFRQCVRMRSRSNILLMLCTSV